MKVRLFQSKPIQNQKDKTLYLIRRISEWNDVTDNKGNIYTKYNVEFIEETCYEQEELKARVEFLQKLFPLSEVEVTKIELPDGINHMDENTKEKIEALKTEKFLLKPKTGGSL